MPFDMMRLNYDIPRIVVSYYLLIFVIQVRFIEFPIDRGDNKKYHDDARKRTQYLIEFFFHIFFLFLFVF